MYFVSDGQDELGPFEAAELLGRRGFDAETLVRLYAGEREWKPAGSFPEFAAAFALAAHVRESLPEPASPPPSPPPPPPLPPAPRGSRPAPAAQKPVAAPPPLVMIVDDEQDVCEIIQYHANKAGFRAVTANSGREAAAKIDVEAPSLIVLDLMMPGQNGYEFLRAMHASGHGRIPVSVITGRKMSSSTLALIREEKNVVEIFAKPFEMPKFIASLQRHLKTSGAKP
jgi:CheY-like chemotaxis protein